jgi:hypothetical protein
MQLSALNGHRSSFQSLSYWLLAACSGNRIKNRRHPEPEFGWSASQTESEDSQLLLTSAHSCLIVTRQTPEEQFSGREHLC